MFYIYGLKRIRSVENGMALNTFHLEHRFAIYVKSLKYFIQCDENSFTPV